MFRGRSCSISDCHSQACYSVGMSSSPRPCRVRFLIEKHHWERTFSQQYCFHCHCHSNNSPLTFIHHRNNRQLDKKHFSPSLNSPLFPLWFPNSHSVRIDIHLSHGFLAHILHVLIFIFLMVS